MTARAHPGTPSIGQPLKQFISDPLPGGLIRAADPDLPSGGRGGDPRRRPGDQRLRRRHVRVWDLATGGERIRMTHDGPVNGVAFSPDGTREEAAQLAQEFEAVGVTADLREVPPPVPR